MALTSWMIADLVSPMNDLEWTHKAMTYKRVLFPAPAVRSTSYTCRAVIRNSKNVRFPWIHKSDPFAFHSFNALLSKNHAAVPLCRAFETKFWFVDGSGGDSQCWTSFSSWSPTEYRRKRKGVEEGNNKRFILFVSLDAWWRVTTPSVS